MVTGILVRVSHPNVWILSLCMYKRMRAGGRLRIWVGGKGVKYFDMGKTGHDFDTSANFKTSCWRATIKGMGIWEAFWVKIPRYLGPWASYRNPPFSGWCFFCWVISFTSWINVDVFCWTSSIWHLFWLFFVCKRHWRINMFFGSWLQSRAPLQVLVACFNPIRIHWQSFGDI